MEAVIKTLLKNGFEAYLVGGCVRDALRRIKPKDWDITTNATPDRISALFNRITKYGARHGTVGVIFDEKNIVEVTTYRLDGEYTDGRRPDNVLFTEDIIQDLARRDFTINAMAYSRVWGLVDPFGGRKDIKNKIIKCVGSPSARLSEDALRMVRAVRFAAVFKYDIHSSVFRAIRETRFKINLVSRERIRDEFFKIITGEKGIALFSQTGLLSEVLKIIEKELELKLNENELIKNNKYAANYNGDDAERLALLVYSSKAGDLAKGLRASNSVIKMARSLGGLLETNARFKEQTELRSALNKYGLQVTSKYLDIVNFLRDFENSKNFDWVLEAHKNLEQIKENGDCFNLNALEINGDDLIKAGFRGKEIGAVLNKLLKHVIRFPEDNKKIKLLEIIKNINL